MMKYVGMTLAQIEREAIEEATKFYPNNDMAANALGIATRTLYNKLKEYKDSDAEKLEIRKKEKEESEKLTVKLLHGYVRIEEQSKDQSEISKVTKVTRASASK